MQTSAAVAIPPTQGHRSIRITEAPCRAALMAAAIPAVPPPHTNTSASASTGTLRSGITTTPGGLPCASAAGAAAPGTKADMPRPPPAAAKRNERRLLFIVNYLSGVRVPWSADSVGASRWCILETPVYRPPVGRPGIISNLNCNSRQACLPCWCDERRGGRPAPALLGKPAAAADAKQMIATGRFVRSGDYGAGFKSTRSMPNM